MLARYSLVWSVCDMDLICINQRCKIFLHIPQIKSRHIDIDEDILETDL